MTFWKHNYSWPLDNTEVRIIDPPLFENPSIVLWPALHIHGYASMDSTKHGLCSTVVHIYQGGKTTTMFKWTCTVQTHMQGSTIFCFVSWGWGSWSFHICGLKFHQTWIIHFNNGKSKRVPGKHLFLLYWLCQSLWLCGSQ